MNIASVVQKSIVSSVMCNSASSGFAPVPEACNWPQLQGHDVRW